MRPGPPRGPGLFHLRLRRSFARRRPDRYDRRILTTGGNARRGLEEVRALVFLATGLAVPLFAFPIFRYSGRPVDAATTLAAVFVVASLPALLSFRRSRVAPAFAVVAALAPLVVLVPPRPASFSIARFLTSEAHWILVTLFFAAALTLRPDPAWLRRIVFWNLAAGSAVALFAIYQLVGNPRSWPGTGPVLFSFQREPFRFTPVGATFRGGGYMRPTSLFLEPAWMGGYLAWIVALAVLWPADRRRGIAALRVGAALLGTGAILASISWGAYADLLAVLAVGLAWRARRRSSGRALAAGVAAALLLGALLLATPPGRRVLGALGERLSLLKTTAEGQISAGADTPRVRLQNASHAWGLFVENPWKGVGLGQFGRYRWERPGAAGTSAPATGQSFDESLPRRDPWFGWLTIAAEAGVLGPIVLALAVAIAASRARGPAAGAVAALAALAVVQQVHTGSYIDLWWWYPLALASVLGAAGGGARVAGGVRE